MPVPMLDLSGQHKPLLGRMCEVFEEVARSGQFVLGPRVEAFERGLAELCGVRHAVGMSSGTDALLAAMMAVGVGPGDEVITRPLTFFATAGSIARLGAKPVFVDIEPDTFNINANLIEAAIGGRTRAVIPVHLYGQMADMTAIMEVARRHGLKVIEDAAQAIGAEDQGRLGGSIGDVGCHSFYPTKNLSALGDAGACTTHDDALAQQLRTLRNHGQTARYTHTYLGGNFRIDALQAALLSLKLPCWGAWQQARRDAAGYYREGLKGLAVGLPAEKAGKLHVYHQFTIRVFHGRRDALREHLRAKQIETEVYYPSPLHLQGCLAYLGYRKGDFPEAERASREVLSLPIYVGISPAQQDEVIQGVYGFFHGP